MVQFCYMRMRPAIPLLSLAALGLLIFTGYAFFHVDTESSGMPANIGPSEVLTDQTQHMPDVSTARTRLTGDWQSTDPEPFRREFRADDTFTDTLSKEAARTGRWKLFSSDTENPLRIPLEEGALYIEILYPAQEALYTKVLTLTEKELELIELSSGRTTRFTRVP